jgi:hypothetical protein
MTVGTLDTFLRRLADVMEAADGKAAGIREVRVLADRLAPFGGLSLAAFGDFLVKAEAYSRGDLAAVFGTKKATARQPKAAADPDRVPAAVERLKALYGRALDASFTPDAVRAAVQAIKGFAKPEVDQVAAGCGFHQKFKTKAAVLDALEKWILDRKGTFERAQV